MTAFHNATPTERFKISEIAAKRMRKSNAAFEWSAFVVMREQVAREQAHKLSTMQKLLLAVCDLLDQVSTMLRLTVLKS